MSEAEVSLRFACGLIESGAAVGEVDVALDGAQIRTGETEHFPIHEFLEACGWVLGNGNGTWRGNYTHENHRIGFRVHSSSGTGDVVAPLSNGRTLRVESKKGTLVRSRSSSEYPLLREALGQLLTVEEANPTDILAVAVPFSEKFEALAVRWRKAPLIVRAGIHIATVDRNNEIHGLESIGI